MQLLVIDFVVLGVFVMVMLYIALSAKKTTTSVEEYFFAGKDLTWPVVGISIIAANISSEHFVGMAAEGYKIGLAVASYEWTAAIVMVIVALFILPKFLRAGIHTLPEFLEYRYNKYTRLIMACFVLITYAFVLISSVIYAGSVLITGVFGYAPIYFVWIIGILAAFLVSYGGMAFVVKSNTIFGWALVAGGVITTILGFIHIGGFDNFVKESHGKLHSLLPASDPSLPWTTVFLGGLWILHFNYWGFNQFILQNPLSSKSLSEGQKGIMFAATIKLLTPFFIVIPGIIAYAMADGGLEKADDAYPFLMNILVPNGFRGIQLCVLLGAVLSTLHSQIQAASLIFTFDIYKRYIRPEAKDQTLVSIGRVFSLLVVVVACLWAPIIAGYKDGIYEYIQLFWGMIAPGIVTVFILGIIIQKSPPISANLVLILNPILYVLSMYFYPNMPFLDKSGIVFLILVVITIIYTLINPLNEPPLIPEKNNIKFERNLLVFIWGIFIFIITMSLYIAFL